MIPKLILIKNDSYETLDLAKQMHIENMAKMVAGSKFCFGNNFETEICSESFREGVVLIPVISPTQSNIIVQTLAELEKNIPFRNFFAVLFLVVVEDSNFLMQTDINTFWINCIDKFYDCAVPTGFVLLYKENVEIQTFNVVATITTLLRDVDNLGELKKINEVIQSLEEQVNRLEKKL